MTSSYTDEGCLPLRKETAVLLKSNQEFQRPQYKCWKPSEISSLLPSITKTYVIFDLESPTSTEDIQVDVDPYQDFHFILRTVHFEDYLEILSCGKMKTNPLTEESHSVLSTKTTSFKGLWFGVSDGKKKGQNNWYGNVSFQVDLTKFLNHLGTFHIYFVEVVEFRYSCSSRILISRKEYDLPSYDPKVKGGPWFRNETGRDMSLSHCRTYDGILDQKEDMFKDHVLEFILDVGDLTLSVLQVLGQTEATNHSEANNGSYCKCRKYNSGRKWSTCPSAWSEKETLIKMLDS